MDQVFPPPPPPVPPSFWAVVLHLLLLGLAVSSIAGLFVKGRRPAQAGDAVLWLAVIVVATGLCLAGATHSEINRPFLVGYMLFVWVVAGTAFFMTLVRRGEKGAATAILWVLGSLLCLGCLIALMLPAVPQARESARRTQCKNHLMQIGLALHNWHDAHGRFPDAAAAEPDLPPMSWRVSLLPYLEQPHLKTMYDPMVPWDDKGNLHIAQTGVWVYRCPSNGFGRDDQQRYFTAYALITGPRTVFPDGRGLALDGITDGTSSTIMAAEACGLEIVWTRPADIDTRDQPAGVNLPGERPTHSPGMLSSHHHPGGAHVLRADGSVHFVSDKIDPRVLKAAATATGGERFDDL